MRYIRFFIILWAVFSTLSGHARATDNRTFERFYNLSYEEFDSLLNRYHNLNYIDSAMLCANIQASKFGKGKLSLAEVISCCSAYRYMSLTYLVDYYNYQIAAENHLKAKQIADEYELMPEQVFIAADEAAFTAIRNNLENNFVYNNIIMDSYKKVFNLIRDEISLDNKEQYRDYLESATSNLMYTAILFDKTHEVTSEIQTYSEIKRRCGFSADLAETLCLAVKYYNSGDYVKAFEALSVPIPRPDYCSDKDLITLLSMVKNSQYIFLLKDGNRAEALRLLLQQEQFLRETEMSFELLEVLHLIKQHYEMEGNKALADKYALLYYTTKDEFINKSRLGKIDQAKLNLELEQTRERVREMTYRGRMQGILLWSAVIITLLALGILSVLYVNYRKTKRTNRILYEKNVALLSSTKEVQIAPAASDSNEPAEPSLADRELMERITAVMESSPEVFAESFSLSRLAELVGSNSKYVSQAINSCMRCNFSAFLNGYRIKEACRRLMDTTNYGNYTIEGIAGSLGYKSRSNFTTIFKEKVGLTPSAFQKLSRDRESDSGQSAGIHG